MTPTPEQIAAALAFFEALSGCTDTQKHGKVLAAAYRIKFSHEAELITTAGKVIHAEVLRRDIKEMLSSIPRNAEQMIAFIGSNYGSMSPVGEDGHPVPPLDNVRYYLSVHDLLSAFSWADLSDEMIEFFLGENLVDIEISPALPAGEEIK